MIRTLVALLFAFQLSLAHADIASDIGADTSLTNAITAAQNARAAEEDSVSIFNQLVDAGVDFLDALEATIWANPVDTLAIVAAANLRVTGQEVAINTRANQAIANSGATAVIALLSNDGVTLTVTLVGSTSPS